MSGAVRRSPLRRYERRSIISVAQFSLRDPEMQTNRASADKLRVGSWGGREEERFLGIGDSTVSARNTSLNARSFPFSFFFPRIPRLDFLESAELRPMRKSSSRYYGIRISEVKSKLIATVILLLHEVSFYRRIEINKLLNT